MVNSFMQAPPACPHNYNPATCYVCKAEAVRAGVKARGYHIEVGKTTEADKAERCSPPLTLHYADAPFVPPDLTTTWPRAIAIVALRRIVDRAVSDELHSPATADILRIALLALNQLED